MKFDILVGVGLSYEKRREEAKAIAIGKYWSKNKIKHGKRRQIGGISRKVG